MQQKEQKKSNIFYDIFDNKPEKKRANQKKSKKE